MSSACGAVALPGCTHRAKRLAHALARLGEVRRVQPHVELRQVEAEHLDARPQVGEPAVGDPLPAVRAQAAVDEVEVGEQLGGRRDSRPGPSASVSPSRCQTNESLRR